MEFLFKQKVMNVLIADLEQNLKMLIQSAFEAKMAATSEESKPENKYDTRGLEASYLAGAQAQRAKDLEFSIGQLKKIPLKDFSDQSGINLTALVEVEINSEEKKMFFVLPSMGGNKILIDALKINVISPESPLGLQLMGKTVGDIFLIRTKNLTSEYEILNVL